MKLAHTHTHKYTMPTFKLERKFSRKPLTTSKVFKVLYDVYVLLFFIAQNSLVPLFHNYTYIWTYTNLFICMKINVYKLKLE